MKIIDFEKYQNVQLIAKNVLGEIEEYINPESTEETIVRNCKELLLKYGINQTWYYNCPALVLLGSRSCLSVSGKDYIPAKEKAGTINLITIDLSPLDGEIWGDCSRSYILEEGKIKNINEIENEEFKEGIIIENKLHEYYLEFVKPEMTFSSIYYEMNRYINKFGYVNIDFMNNIGHSIEKNRNDRSYFEEKNINNVTSNMMFTFEPHIKKMDGKWGFKCENIYFFNESKLEIL